MRDRVLIGVLGLVLSALTVALLAGHGPWAGHEIVSLSVTHGINAGDMPVLLSWLLGLGCCWALWRRT